MNVVQATWSGVICAAQPMWCNRRGALYAMQSTLRSRRGAWHNARAAQPRRQRGGVDAATRRRWGGDSGDEA
eukprot:5067633-Pyramimonas_sp.AAC.1